MKDVLGIGKVLPLDKLVDVVSKAVGRVSKSYFDKVDARTEAYRTIKQAEAKADEIKLIATAVKENEHLTNNIKYTQQQVEISVATDVRNKGETPIISDIYERSVERINFQQTKKQLNIESVTFYAAEQLKNENFVSDEQLNDDWINRFFKITEDISNDEMQMLWGRILAGEIKHPKSFSLRTLEVLKNLTKEEAEVFKKFAEIKLENNTGHDLIFNGDNGDFLQKEFQITYSDILLVTELGLIVSENNQDYIFFATNQSKGVNHLYYGNKVILFHRGEQTPDQRIPVLAFTRIGAELSKLVEINNNSNYISKICNHFKHPNVKIQIGDKIINPQGLPEAHNLVDYIY